VSELAFVVEDDEDLATIFTEALQSSNFRVETIRDGSVARERLKQVEPRVVVLDMHLPGVSGADLLTQIRSDEGRNHVVVVIATADVRLGEAYTNVADFVLIKPITFTQLRDLTSRIYPNLAQFTPI
jgi:DNA-binding response OmpR family regulator